MKGQAGPMPQQTTKKSKTSGPLQCFVDASCRPQATASCILANLSTCTPRSAGNSKSRVVAGHRRAWPPSLPRCPPGSFHSVPSPMPLAPFRPERSSWRFSVSRHRNRAGMRYDLSLSFLLRVHAEIPQWCCSPSRLDISWRHRTSLNC